MRNSRVVLNIAKAPVADYLDYLLRVDKELPSLHEVFPKSSAMEDVIKFHTSLCAFMEENAYPLVGFKVIPPGYDSITTLRGSEPVCFPIFANLFQGGSLSVKKDRLQYVEAAVCLEIKDLLNGCNSVESAAANCSSFSPCIGVAGSRFPFYAPTLAAMACDLDGCVNIVKGKDVTISGSRRSTFVPTRFVLTHNKEPIQVGSPKLCMESPYAAAVIAASYAKTIKAPVRQNLFVFCGGVCPRTPIMAGTYAFEWGPHGRLTYFVLP